MRRLSVLTWHQPLLTVNFMKKSILNVTNTRDRARILIHGAPGYFTKITIFTTLSFEGIAIGHLSARECVSYLSSQSKQWKKILKIPPQKKIRDHEFDLSYPILTYFDGFVSHWCTFGRWLIAPDYQSRRCCPPSKCEKSHSPKVHHQRAAPNRSWPNLL